jgi:hypothetical protein
MEALVQVQTVKLGVEIKYMVLIKNVTMETRPVVQIIVCLILAILAKIK